MPATATKYLFLLPLLLLFSCRSEKAAFQFQHPVPVVAVWAPVADVTLTADSAPATPALPVAALAITSTGPATPTATRQGPAVGLRLSSLPEAQHPVIKVSKRHFARPHGAGEPDNTLWHLVLGAALVVGGVAAGLLLGGWLGFGVGAASVLLGYYFVVLGIGGPHAWLGVMQEFFNM